MKAVFGVVSLLVVLAVVALLATRAVKSTVATPPGTASAPQATVRQQSVQIPEQVRQDVNKALEESTRRLDAADK